MISRRCPHCIGTGIMMGGGMLTKACETCSGDKEIQVIDKESGSYKSAISRIKKLDKNISDDVAHQMFEKEFNNLDKEVENVVINDKPIKKRGRQSFKSG